MTQKMDEEQHLLAAMAYGESSTENNDEEMAAIASVLVRQRDARGYSSMQSFVKGEPSFSFVVSDSNKRFNRLMKATAEEIEHDEGMNMALICAIHALSGGFDKSGGAYFWDGADIKTHYSTHPKVRQGIHFTDPAHNIYGIKESKRIRIIQKEKRLKDSQGEIKTVSEEIGRFDHVYDSTAAVGGTIFWKFNPDYISLMHAKEYK